MYKKSAFSTPLNIFDSYSQQLIGSKLAKLEDPSGWHNQFFNEITSQIDEDIFSILYHGNNGRPNAPIRILVSMLILKDGEDWTDEQLFDACDFNILVCRAIGLNNLSDEAPCGATYYNFKASLLNHYVETGENLLEKAFQKTTATQIIRYNVNGKRVRMDSKLLHSNVATGTRLSLCLSVLRKFYSALSETDLSLLNEVCTEEDKTFFAELIKQTVSQQTYRLNKSGTQIRLLQSGQIANKLLQIFKGIDVEDYDLVQRIWQDHFELCEQEPSKDESGNSSIEDKIEDSTPFVQLKDVKNQSGTTLQSAHDPEAAYRNKLGSKKQVVVGYVSNITETCAEAEQKEDALPLRLITDVQTEQVTHSDDKFFIPALQNSEEVLGQKIEASLTDGAYNSVKNLEFTRNSEHPIEWFLTAIQGAEGNYDFEKIEDQTYRITDRTNGRIQIATLKGKSYRIENDHSKAKYYYIRPETIDNYFRRQQIKEHPPNIYALRANCEATVNQVFNNLDGAKTKYRGLFQHKIYAINRCFWTNLQRIKAQKAILLFLAFFDHLLLPRATGRQTQF